MPGHGRWANNLKMKKYIILAALLICVCVSGAAWHLYSNSRIKDMTIGKLSKCSIHSQEMDKRIVPIVYGLINALEFKESTFPNGRTYFLGGCIVQNDTRARIYVCPKCEELRKQTGFQNINKP